MWTPTITTRAGVLLGLRCVICPLPSWHVATIQTWGRSGKTLPPSPKNRTPHKPSRGRQSYSPKGWVELCAISSVLSFKPSNQHRKCVTKDQDSRLKLIQTGKAQGTTQYQPVRETGIQSEFSSTLWVVSNQSWLDLCLGFGQVVGTQISLQTLKTRNWNSTLSRLLPTCNMNPAKRKVLGKIIRLVHSI